VVHESSQISIRGARTHNLKGIDLDLPKGRLTVISGVSGSGKSSLAFDTLYAEGQRRYVESLSAYARQFLDRVEKPDVDRIDGLTPAIAIDQRAATPNPRSTIATLTEIHDYLRVLYASLGIPHDPETGAPLRRLTTPDICADLLGRPPGTKLILLAPIEEKEKLADPAALRDHLKRQGFVRARLNGQILEIEDMPVKKFPAGTKVEIVVDRLVIKDGLDSRMADSVETARRWSPHRVLALVQAPGAADWTEEIFPTSFTNPETGFTLPEPSPRHFSFNSPHGACPVCHGIGSVPGPDPARLVPDPSRSLDDGAIKCWWPSHKTKMVGFWKREIDALAKYHGVARDQPFASLPEKFRHELFHGTRGRAIPTGWSTGPGSRSIEKPFEGLLAQLQGLLDAARSETLRRHLGRFVAHRPCPECGGRRLLPWVLAVTLGRGEDALSIDRWCAMTVEEALAWMDRFPITAAQETFAGPLTREIRQRLCFLHEVGLGYLTLDREAATLSGGEFQRIRLATQIGSGLSGVLYVLDEPSVGLHQRDNDRLLASLHGLRALGNTIVLVEHDADTLKAADHLVDIGPGAGHRGGELLYSGPLDPLLAEPSLAPRSLTGAYLRGEERISAPGRRRPPDDGDLFSGKEHPGWISLTGARGHNLKSVDLSIPLGCLVAVAGVSGSGKSTLIMDTLCPALSNRLGQGGSAPLDFESLEGVSQIDKLIPIDQSPIGRSQRSNPATFTGAFDLIRSLFSQTPAARARGYTSARFSFNRPGGRCETCQGQGSQRVDMHFLADVEIPCESCAGRRFNRETLEVTFKGRDISKVLDLTVDEARDFFGAISDVARKLESLRRAGLGYLRLGQPCDTLSGGEAQRLKLAAELARKAGPRTLYLLDEPTTGLHFADIQVLLDNLFALRDQGHTVLVVEHQLDVIRLADWVIELGPEGGPGGGRIIAAGPPEVLAAIGTPTGKYLSHGKDARVS
jgi:excinuclease ABC subunit A